MYYAHFILSKKGPLAKIWLAAHWDKKLTKAQIYETNIESTIETILEPKMKLALRTSGHLLVGVCRIYSRKIKYLLADCNETFVKIKMAFRPGLVDMPKEKQQANADAITLQEKFPEFDINFVDINMEDMDLSTNLTIQQARIEDITLKEDYGHMIITQDDDFGDMGFGMASLLMNGHDRDDLLFDHMAMGTTEPLVDLNQTPGLDRMETDVSINNENDNVNQIMDMTPGHVESETPAVLPNLFEEQTGLLLTHLDANGDDEPSCKLARKDDAESNEENEKENQENPLAANTDTTTATNKLAAKLDKQRQTRKRKKLVIDEIKEIDGVSMKAQLSDTSNIVATLELAPPTRQLMFWKESGTIERLFMHTSRELNSKVLQGLYKRNMIVKKDVDVDGAKKDPVDDAQSMLQNTFQNSLFMQENERQRDAHTDTLNNPSNMLPLVDSFIDNNEISKRMANSINNNSTLNNNDLTVGANDLTVNNQELTFDAPQSVFNNFDETIDKLEVTPQVAKEHGEKRKSTNHRKSTTTVHNQTKDDLDDLNDETINDQMKVLTKRAKTMISLLNKSLNKHSNVGFFELTRRNNRKHVAQKFYSLLLLKKFDCIDVTQVDMYDDVILCKGDKFDTFISSSSASFVNV